MKKSAWLAGILLLASIAVFCVGYKTIYALRDHVDIGETTLMGDKSAAAGLQATAKLMGGNHLIWDADFPVDQKTAVRSDFHFSQRGESQFSSGDPHYDMSLIVRGAAKEYNWNQLTEEEKQYGFNRLIEAVTERTPAGETHTETEALSDYFTFYPLSFSLMLPGETATRFYSGESYANDPGTWESVARPLNEKLNSYFKIPVAGEQMRVVVTKDQNGTVTRLESWQVIEPAQRLESGIWTESVVTDTACYIVVGTTVNGYAYDTSCIEGGYGVYVLPYGEDTVDAGGLANFYPVDAEKAKILDISQTEDKEKLLLYTEETGQLMLTVLDTRTGTAEQKLLLCETAGFGSITTYAAADFITVIQSGGTFALLTIDETGRMTRAFTGNFKSLDPSSGNMAVLNGYTDMGYDQNLTMAYEKGRLAVMDSPSGVDFYVAVYDKTGILYLGRYICSVATPPSFNAFSLSWTDEGNKTAT